LLITLKAFVCSKESPQGRRDNVARGTIARILSVCSKFSGNFGPEPKCDLFVRLLIFGLNQRCWHAFSFHSIEGLVFPEIRDRQAERVVENQVVRNIWIEAE
jgi:hypothetical protein